MSYRVGVVSLLLPFVACSGGGGDSPSSTIATLPPPTSSPTASPTPSPFRTPNIILSHVAPPSSPGSPIAIARNSHLDIALYVVANGLPNAGTTSNGACVQTPLRESAPIGADPNAFYFSGYATPNALTNCTATLILTDGIGVAYPMYVIVP